MAFPDKSAVDALKREWTDKLVRVKTGREDLKRFEGKLGRVVTVNYGGRAVVDFADGAWYDIADFASVLVPAEGDFDTKLNSAQPLPGRQG
jgi:hypothetical protein